MFSRVPESLRTKAGSGSSLKFPVLSPGEPKGKGPLKTAPAQGGGALAMTHLCGHVHPRAPPQRPAPRPWPWPSPKGADAIRSQGPSQLLGQYVPFIPGALAAQSSWDSCPA